MNPVEISIKKGSRKETNHSLKLKSGLMLLTFIGKIKSVYLLILNSKVLAGTVPLGIYVNINPLMPGGNKYVWPFFYHQVLKVKRILSIDHDGCSITNENRVANIFNI